MEERIIELETKISYQDQTIEDLNQVVIELRAEIAVLRKEVLKLKDMVDDENIKDQSLEVPPPHYQGSTHRTK